MIIILELLSPYFRHNPEYFFALSFCRNTKIIKSKENNIFYSSILIIILHSRILSFFPRIVVSCNFLIFRRFWIDFSVDEAQSEFDNISFRVLILNFCVIIELIAGFMSLRKEAVFVSKSFGGLWHVRKSVENVGRANMERKIGFVKNRYWLWNS